MNFEKRGPILIVGDDDQAVYDERCASPDHLRAKVRSGQYEVFELPFCSRCPQVIVEAVKSLVELSEEVGNLKGRIRKRYECFVAEKKIDGQRFPKIMVARCTNAQTISNYVSKAIGRIERQDIEESWVAGKEYPTALIVGKKQYLAKLEKNLRKDYSNVKYAKPQEAEYGPADGYKTLLSNPTSNLGWRILAESFLGEQEFANVLGISMDGTPMVQLLENRFLETHRAILEILRGLMNGYPLTDNIKGELQQLLGDSFGDLLNHFVAEEEIEEATDKTKPSILLTSFKGCKGLSAGHVFIVGANNGSIPKDPNSLRDIEISQFIVALTRTRKQCHIISNKWLYEPKDKQGKWIQQMEETSFLDFIPGDFLNHLGVLNAEKIRAL